ncbi:MAG: energy transducer TonB [Deltaproteobacteria bacterium]|nr:energy transducer TonB [Deltaproteobacteria bacterium]
MNLRFPVSIGLSVLVTFGLFWVMQALITVSGELKDATRTASIEFVRLKRDTRAREKEREPPKRAKPDAPPPPPDIAMSKARLDPGEGVGGIAPDIDASDVLDGGLGGGGADRDAVPLVRIEPDYPMRAEQRRIEGWVVVQFTISKAGTIKNPIVQSSHPGNIFDRSALQAVRKWKYNPKIEGGVAVEQPGIRVRLDFEL